MLPASLSDAYQKLGATVDDAGVVQRFRGRRDEAEAAAACGAVRDLSACGILVVRGEDRVSFLNGQCTQDIPRLGTDGCTEVVFTSNRGRVLDHALVFATPEHLGILTSPGQGAFLAEHLGRRIVMEDCLVEPVGRQVALLAVGPEARARVGQALDAELAADGPGAAALDTPLGAVTVLRAPAPLGTGWRLLVAADQAGPCFQRLVDAGLAPMGQEAFEQVRIESGLAAMGKEAGEHTNPLEAGLMSAVSFDKGCYVGQEVVARLKTYAKVKRQLTGLRFPPDTDPTHLGDVYWDLLRVGQITSATRSERLGATLALAMVKTEYAKPGTAIYSVLDGERIDGEVAALPFAAAP